jgi:flagellar hook-associated protein 2
MTNVDTAASANNGFAKKIAAWADGLLGNDGALTGKSKSIQSQLTANQKDQDKFNDRLVAIESRIRAQYSALDKTMAQANALSQYVTQQITTWNKSTA